MNAADVNGERGPLTEREDGEQKIASALAPFGWTCTEDFWQRYYSDPWVFNLATAVERLTYGTREITDAHLTFDEMGEIGLVQEVNRLLLHPIGLALARHEDGTLTVLTDPDPEGWRFAGFDLTEKADSFAARQAEWHPRREAALGYVVQPLDDPVTERDSAPPRDLDRDAPDSDDSGGSGT